MKIRQIKRSATCAWSPGQQLPLLALGTVSGAVDMNFSSASEIEIYDLQLDELRGSSPVRLSNVAKLGGVVSASKFNRIAWGYTSPDPKRAYGVLAGGMENGELCLYNATAIVEGRSTEAVLAKNTAHRGGVRGLDFNALNTNLLASGAGEGEIFIWDMNNPAKPYSPGARSNKLEDISALAWNRGFASVIASASNNGATVVWDLRNRTEVLALPHPAGRKMITGLAWNPEEAMQIVTISDDDYNPAILLWDCRNARAPLRALTGHSKGVLSVAWCPKDSGLLISAGKDNRTLCWDVRQGAMLGELQTSANWAFDVQWSSCNPDLVAVGSFDRRVAVHSLMGLKNVTVEEDDAVANTPTAHTFGQDDNSFSAALQQGAVASPAPAASTGSAFVLPRAPKWMRRGCSAVWGFGGRLAVFTTGPAAAPGPDGKTVVTAAAKATVAVRVPVTDRELYQRLVLMAQVSTQAAPEQVYAYCVALKEIHDRRAAAPEAGPFARMERDYWSCLGAMVAPEPRQELLAVLGFAGGRVHDPALDKILAAAAEERPPSPRAAPEEPEGGDALPPPKPGPPLQLYPAKADAVDALITRAVVVGDYESAVRACLQQNRMAEALLLATIEPAAAQTLVPLVRTQLLKQSRDSKPYLRVADAAVRRDLADIVDHAELRAAAGGDAGALLWRDLLAFVCTHASAGQFAPLCERLARRLESMRKQDGSPADGELGFAASLCLLGAGAYDPVVRHWLRSEALSESFAVETGKRTHQKVTRSAAHFAALQDLVEKVVLSARFARSGSAGGLAADAPLAAGVAVAAAGEDTAAAVASAEPAATLNVLYAKYIDYASFVAQSGRVDVAINFLAMVPAAYKSALVGSAAEQLAVLQYRCAVAAGPAVASVLGSTPQFPFDYCDLVEPERPPTPEADNQPLWAQYGHQAPSGYPSGYSAGYPSGAPNGYSTGYPSAAPNGHAMGYSTGYPQASYPQAQTQPPAYTQTNQPPGFPVAPQAQPPAPVSATSYASAYASSGPHDRYQQYGAPAGQPQALPPMGPPPMGNQPMVPPMGNPQMGNQMQRPAMAAPPYANVVVGPPQTAVQPAQPLPPGPPSSMTVPPKHGFNDAPDLAPDVNRLIPKARPAPPPQLPQMPQMPGAVVPPARAGSFAAASPVYYANGAAAPAPAPPAATPPPPPVPEAPKRYPAGDRSHIPPEQRAIVIALSKALDDWRRRCAPAQKRTLDDSARKVSLLLDELNNGEVPAPVVALLASMSQALDSRQYAVAVQTVIVLLTSHSQPAAAWGSGIRRLCEALQAM